MWDLTTTHIGLVFVDELQHSNAYVPSAEQPTQHSQTSKTHWLRQIQLALGNQLITIGLRLSPAHPILHATTHPGTATMDMVDLPASD